MVKTSLVGEVRSLMRVFEQVVVFLSVITQCSRIARSVELVNNGDVYLALIEDSVKRLADSLAEIYPSEYGDAKPCGLCTQDECHPLNGNLVCANVTKNTRCNQHFPTCPASIRVTRERSALAYPRENLWSLPDKPQTRTICGTQALDPVFKELFARNPYFADYYVGFPDGSRRSYPGREEADPTSLHSCTSYDCRKRPWFNSAITYQNHVVILLDTRSVPLDASITEQGDTLKFSKVFAKALLETVYFQDRINVVAFDSQPKAQALENPSVVVQFNDTDAQRHDELDDLKMKIDRLSASQSDVRLTSSNLTSGLQEALGLFADAQPADKMTKNIIVFTNGDISIDEMLNKTLDEVTGQLVRLFIFSMKSTDQTVHSLQILNAMANRTSGLHVKLTSSGNPLYQMRSYFGYLASLQEKSGRVMPFWTPAYRDYYDIGKIITVTYPVFSKNDARRFIGVAAVDVLYLEIGDILDDFKAALDKRESKGGEIDEAIFKSITPYDDSVYDSYSDPTNDANAKAMCKQEKQIDPNQNFLDRLCCDNCPASRRDSRASTYIASSIGGVVLVLLVAISIFFYRRRRSSTPKVEADCSGHDYSSSQSTTPRTPSQESLIAAGHRQLKGDMPRGSPHKIHQTLSRLCVDKLSEPDFKTLTP